MTPISVVIVNWNTRELLAQAIDSLQAQLTGRPLDIIVVDNGSSDGSQAMLRARYPALRLLANAENRGFGPANNQGVAAARGDYVLLFNSDAWATDDFLAPLAAVLDAEPRAAIVGAQLRNPDGSFQASHTPFPTLRQEFLTLTGIGRRVARRNYPTRGPEEARGARPVDYVEGACLLLRKAAFDAVGGFDEAFFMYAEDVDLCYRLTRAGWQVWYQPQARVRHMSAGSSRQRLTNQAADMYQSRVRYFAKHHGAPAAQALRLQILLLTAAKKMAYGLLRRVLNRPVGRDQVSLAQLHAKLRRW